MIKKYIKVPVVIEAIQWDGKNTFEIEKFVGKGLYTEIHEHISSLIIPTLEGNMKASEGDYIIKGVKGEFYPCKPDIFKQTYEEATDVELSTMTFGQAIEALKDGLCVRRKGWNGKNMFVLKQVPAHIDSNIIPKMQSLPEKAKELILNNKGFVDYTSQCLLFNGNTGRADSWTPSIADVFAEDWEIVD